MLPHHMHMGCTGLASLSFSQLDALEVLHHAALARCAHTLALLNRRTPAGTQAR